MIVFIGARRALAGRLLTRVDRELFRTPARAPTAALPLEGRKLRGHDAELGRPRFS